MKILGTGTRVTRNHTHHCAHSAIQCFVRIGREVDDAKVHGVVVDKVDDALAVQGVAIVVLAQRLIPFV